MNKPKASASNTAIAPAASSVVARVAAVSSTAPNSAATSKVKPVATPMPSVRTGPSGALSVTKPRKPAGAPESRADPARGRPSGKRNCTRMALGVRSRVRASTARVRPIMPKRWNSPSNNSASARMVLSKASSKAEELRSQPSPRPSAEMPKTPKAVSRAVRSAKLRSSLPMVLTSAHRAYSQHHAWSGSARAILPETVCGAIG